MNYNWKQFPKCWDCGCYRDHDNHMPFEKCNADHEPCRFPERHHKFVPRPVDATEPRVTIVREMYAAWQGRNAISKQRASVSRPLIGSYTYRDVEVAALAGTYAAQVEALDSIRRIWHAMRDGDYL